MYPGSGGGRSGAVEDSCAASASKRSGAAPRSGRPPCGSRARNSAGDAAGVTGRAERRRGSRRSRQRACGRGGETPRAPSRAALGAHAVSARGTPCAYFPAEQNCEQRPGGRIWRADAVLPRPCWRYSMSSSERRAARPRPSNGSQAWRAGCGRACRQCACWRKSRAAISGSSDPPPQSGAPPPPP